MDNGVPAIAPPLDGRVLFDQRWTDLAFLHWPVAPEAVAPFLPRGVRPDVIDGVTYVGLMPFHMRGAGLGRGHPTRYLGDFLETNVRLYGVDDAGPPRRGVPQPRGEPARHGPRRAVGLPAAVRLVTDEVAVAGDTWTWTSRRRWPDRGLRTRISIRVGDPVADPTDLDVWLTARWGLHHQVAGRAVWTPNEHEPWPLRSAEVLDAR